MLDDKLKAITEKSTDTDTNLVESISHHFIKERFMLMEQGIKQAEKNLMSIKEKLSVQRRRTTLDCTGSMMMNHDAVKVYDYSKSIDNIHKNVKTSKMSIIVKGEFCARERSIDYPYIVRRTPNMSDVVRKRLLFQKVMRKVRHQVISFLLFVFRVTFGLP